MSRASNCHGTIPALRLGLNFDGHTSIIKRDVALAHAHKRISPQEKREGQHAGCGCAAQEQRWCCLRQVQDVRHDRRGNGPSRNHLLFIIFSLLFAETTTKQLNDMTDGGFLESHIGVPRIDGREVLLQTTRFDALFISQVAQIRQDMLTLSRKRADSGETPRRDHHGTVINPACELTRVAEPSRLAATAGQEAGRRSCARKTTGESAHHRSGEIGLPRLSPRLPSKTSASNRVAWLAKGSTRPMWRGRTQYRGMGRVNHLARRRKASGHHG